MATDWLKLHYDLVDAKKRLEAPWANTGKGIVYLILETLILLVSDKVSGMGRE